MAMDIISKQQKKQVTVAIVDSGIDIKASDLAGHVKISTGFRVDDNGFIIEDNSMVSRHEHATSIALIIKHLCDNVEFISVNILNEQLVTDGRILIRALEDTLKYKPDIINLSLGTTKWKYVLPLKKIIKMASKNDTVIVAASKNEGLKSYPACLRGVVGVKAKVFGNSKDICYERNYFYAPYTLDFIDVSKEHIDMKSRAGSSMSAAYISGHIALTMCSQGFSSATAAVEHLKLKAVENKKK